MSERVHKNSSYLNAKSTVGTLTRVKDVSPTSGMCPLCIRDCPFLCEVGLSTFRGREALYPEQIQFGYSTASALEDFRAYVIGRGVYSFIRLNSILTAFTLSKHSSSTTSGLPHSVGNPPPNSSIMMYGNMSW